MKLFICSDVLGNFGRLEKVNLFFVLSETIRYPGGYWSNVRGHRAVVLSLEDSR